TPVQSRTRRHRTGNRHPLPTRTQKVLPTQNQEGGTMKEETTGVMHDLSWAHQPQAWPWWIWAVLGGCLILALAAAAFFFWKRKNKLVTPSKPLIPPHITALEALRLLEARLDEEKDLEFVVEVS